MPLAALVGVDRQKDRLVENLERFARGLPCNHALLWGVRGTGKSSLAKAAFRVKAEVEAPAATAAELFAAAQKAHGAPSTPVAKAGPPAAAAESKVS